MSLAKLNKELEEYKKVRPGLIMIFSFLLLCFSALIIIYLLNRFYLDSAESKIICTDSYYNAGTALQNAYKYEITPRSSILETTNASPLSNHFPYGSETTDIVTIDYYYIGDNIPATVTQSLNPMTIGISLRTGGASLYYTATPSSDNLINSTLLTLDRITVTGTNTFNSYLIQYPTQSTDGFYYIPKSDTGVSPATSQVFDISPVKEHAPVLKGSQISLLQTLRKQRNACSSDITHGKCTVNDPTFISTKHYCADMIFNSTNNIYCPHDNPGCSIGYTNASRICYPGMKPTSMNNSTAPYTKWGDGYYYMTNSSSSKLTKNNDNFDDTFSIGVSGGSAPKPGPSVSAKYESGTVMSRAPILETHLLSQSSDGNGLISNSSLTEEFLPSPENTPPLDTDSMGPNTNNPWKNNNKPITINGNFDIPDYGSGPAYPSPSTTTTTINNSRLVTLGVNN